MIRSLVTSLLLFSGLTFVETTWLHVLAFQSVRPDLSLIVLVYVSFSNTKPVGQITGFLSGMLHDGISALPFGTTSLLRTAIAWTFNSIAGKFYIDRLVLPFVFVVVATIAKALVLGVLSVIFGSIIPAYDLFGKTLWIEVAYNALLSPFLFLILTPMKRLLVVPEKRT